MILSNTTSKSYIKEYFNFEGNIYRLPEKMYLTLTPYFEVVSTIMSVILGFPSVLDLYNSFDTLLICFHDLMNEW